MMNRFKQVLDSIDGDIRNVDKAELGDWAAKNYILIRLALQIAAERDSVEND